MFSSQWQSQAVHGPELDITLKAFSSEFGLRLAGLTDGEGHFGVVKYRRHGRILYRCVFVLSMRVDDREFVEWLHQTTGLGVVYIGSVQRQRQGWESKPHARWTVTRREECCALADTFERYPLLSKKARDFDVWAKAVRYWNGPRPEGWAPMARWHFEIKKVREFAAAEVELADELDALTLFEDADV